MQFSVWSLYFLPLRYKGREEKRHTSKGHRIFYDIILCFFMRKLGQYLLNPFIHEHILFPVYVM